MTADFRRRRDARAGTHVRPAVSHPSGNRSCTTRLRSARAAVLGLSLATLLPLALPAPAVSAPDDPGRAPDRGLARDLQVAVAGAGFDTVVDFGAVDDEGNPVSPPPRAANSPNVDVAVIRLNPAGTPVGVANVLLSRDYPGGAVVPIDRRTLGTDEVAWYRWELARWDGDVAWDAPRTDADAIMPVDGRERLEFMSPYPASLFKVLVAFQVYRLVDQGRLSLDVSYDWQPARNDCPEGAQPDVRTNRQWLSDMITFSDNAATCALLAQLHELDQVDGPGGLNPTLAKLGLGTLQVNGTNPDTGGRWQVGQIHMTALDTARFLLLLTDGPRSAALWRTDRGRPVTRGVLSVDSQREFRANLAEQGFHEVLSTTNWCGLDYPAQGIPAQVPERWVNPLDGTVTVAGIPYGQDVRPCNDSAPVRFDHKTGLTLNYGSDAGVVETIDGRDRYVIAALGNLGYRFSDASQADLDDFPCFVTGVCYTEAFATLGAAVDGFAR